MLNGTERRLKKEQRTDKTTEGEAQKEGGRLMRPRLNAAQSNGTAAGRTPTGRPPMGRTPAGSIYSRSKQSNAGDSYMYEGGDGDADDVEEGFGKEVPRGSIASKKSEIGAKSKMSVHLSAASK